MMADALKEKAKKHAAARKKVKELQQQLQLKKKLQSERNNQNEDNPKSTLNTTETPQSISQSLDVNAPQTANISSPLHNYFCEKPSNVEATANFFDNILATREPPNLIALNGDNNRRDDDSRAIDDPELKQNEIFNIHQSHAINPFLVGSEDLQIPSQHTEPAEDNGKSVTQEPGELQETYADFDHLPDNTAYSNAESLRQLSSKLSHLIQHEEIVDSHADANSQPLIDLLNVEQTSELEGRNQQLASQLSEERIEREKLNRRVMEYEDRIRTMQNDCEQMKTEFAIKLNEELGPLQEQLKCHAQTIGILVGEKTELTHTLNQNQLMAKLKASECEELQGRLKTSRSRVADLEKEMQSYKAERLKGGVFQEEVQKLRKTLDEIRREKEEAVQDSLELREKLNQKESEMLGLKQAFNDLSHQFAQNEVKLQQITTDGVIPDSRMETLMQEKIALEKALADVRQALKSTVEEREQSNVQYQQYVEQLNKQLASLASRMEEMTVENENLAKREQNLVNHIGDLEKVMQRNQERTTDTKGNGEMKKELDDVRASFDALKLEKDVVDEEVRKLGGVQQQLTRELERRNEIITQMETKIEILESTKPDSAKLFAVMESDKVAASRAVTQNAELKQQLEEMQNAFVKISNDKLELSDQLLHEQYRTRDLSEKVHQFEGHLQKLTDAITIKDRELTQIRDQSTQLNKQLVQQDQLHDRLRHYEAQEGGMQSLQIELHELKHQIHRLQQENAQLKGGNVNENATESVRTDVQDCNDEHSELVAKIHDLTAINEELERKLSVLQTDRNRTESPSEGIEKATDALNILDKESAMKHLEEKFMRTMNDIAALTEEKQRLEHLVVQLQVETETIGEYITLYQHQRGVLKQRTQEKDEQLQRLAQDREAVRAKLDKLNGLVKRLVQEKCALTPELLQKHHELHAHTEELCDEHAKIRKEINIIADENRLSEIDKVDGENVKNNNQDTQIAEQIIAVLSEIKGSSLVQSSSDGLENFHPCPWCSGQLITV